MIDLDSVDVVVLCAGLGRRLRPLTDTIPKALVPVGGKPILLHHLEAMREAGVRRVTCVVGHMHEKIEDFARDGSEFGLSISYVHQNPINGTGGAILAAINHVVSDPFAVLYADIFFQPMVDLWKEILKDPQAKILCAEVLDTSDFGRIESRWGTGGVILDSIVEKDGVRKPGLVNAGLMLLPNDILGILSALEQSPRGELELPQAVEALSQSGRDVRIVKAAQWTDIGTISALHFANQLANMSRHA